MAVKLIADSGATKCEWCLLAEGKKKKIVTTGISPYFLNEEQIVALLQKELLPKLKNIKVEEVYYYGTGLGIATHVKLLKSALKKVFPGAAIEADTDVLGGARALCGNSKGLACNLGTGSYLCYYDGKKIVKNRPGLGYILGDEGSGSYLGKKVIQYYLYETFDEDLKARFENTYHTSRQEILESVYKKPNANSYIASFTGFLAENRGHYMVENIIEDGLNDFFFAHLYKFNESWLYPINFTGSVAYGFRDVLKQLCNTYELDLGKVLKKSMDGLVEYHSRA